MRPLLSRRSPRHLRDSGNGRLGEGAAAPRTATAPVIPPAARVLTETSEIAMRGVRCTLAAAAAAAAVGRSGVVGLRGDGERRPLARRKGQHANMHPSKRKRKGRHDMEQGSPMKD